MSSEYLVFIFIASIAVIQAAAAWRKLDFVFFLRHRYLTFILALLVIIASYYWFFFLGGKHVLDAGGDTQLLIFPVAILLSTAFTFLLSSIINAGRKRKEESKVDVQILREGIEVLNEMTYWQAVRQRLPPNKK